MDIREFAEERAKALFKNPQKKLLDWQLDTIEKIWEMTGDIPIVIAPTGAGKTFLATTLYLYDTLYNQGRKYHLNMNYLLPSRSLAAAKYQQFLWELGEKIPPRSKAPTDKITLQTAFVEFAPHKPVTVTTHFEYYQSIAGGVRIYKRSLLTRFFAFHGLNVYDEFHTLGGLEVLPLALMSTILSTHPKKEINLVLSATLSEYHLRFLPKSKIETFVLPRNPVKRHITTERVPTEEAFEKIIREVERTNELTLLVMNSPLHAEEIFEAITPYVDGGVLLHHGAMTLGEREKMDPSLETLNPETPLEEQVNDPRLGEYVGNAEAPPKLLITTQTVEVGLDNPHIKTVISMPAPIDSLIQRAGRIRRGEGKLIIIDDFELLGPYPESLVQATFETLENEDMTILLEDTLRAMRVISEVYSQVQWGKNALQSAKKMVEYLRALDSRASKKFYDSVSVLGVSFESVDILRNLLQKFQEGGLSWHELREEFKWRARYYPFKALFSDSIEVVGSIEREKFSSVFFEKSNALEKIVEGLKGAWTSDKIYFVVEAPPEIL